MQDRSRPAHSGDDRCIELHLQIGAQRLQAEGRADEDLSALERDALLVRRDAFRHVNHVIAGGVGLRAGEALEGLIVRASPLFGATVVDEDHAPADAERRQCGKRDENQQERRERTDHLPLLNRRDVRPLPSIT